MKSKNLPPSLRWNERSKVLAIVMLSLITTLSYGQKLNKLSQSFKVNKDVIVDLNTNHVELKLIHGIRTQ